MESLFFAFPPPPPTFFNTFQEEVEYCRVNWNGVSGIAEMGVVA